MKWQPIETAPKGKSVLACNSLGYVGRAILLNGKWEHIGKPTHWMPLPAAPGGSPAALPTQQEPLCWVFEDELPKSMTQCAYNALFPHSRVDTVRMFPIFGPASPALDAEAIKAEFLERTGQYLTNDASREACIAEAVAAEREAAAPYARDAIRYRLLRRGQHWSVIDWKGDILRGDELDLTIDAKNEAKAGAKESP